MPEKSMKARFRPDGGVLLSISQGRVYKLNGAGAMAWEILAEHREGLTLSAFASRMAALFDSMNREGAWKCEVPTSHLDRDIARLMQRLELLKLVRVTKNSLGRDVYSISDDRAQMTKPKDPERQIGTDETWIVKDEECHHGRLETLVALLSLTAFDVLLRIAGFDRLVSLVEEYQTAAPRTNDSAIIARTNASVNRAQMYYPKKALCLQRSAVLTVLLRRKGVRAEMVLAARDFPVQGHAWVEVGGQVVNDKPSVQADYSVLTRV
jgi:hypothetical protein